VLNAKYHEQEATIIAVAGRRGGITVATNMAGRGTDIVLGGNVDFLTDQRLRARGLDPVETPDEYEVAWHEELPIVKEEAGAEAAEVIEAGGLYVLGTERHESRRIDNQLRGRSGRQGDPGESRFYLSLSDELMRRFNGAALEAMLNRLNLPDDVPIENKMVTRAIKSAQTQVEQQNFEVRKNVLKYDEVLNQQRKVIYAERRRILEGENLKDQALDMVRDVVTAYVDGATVEGYAEDWDLDALWSALKTLYPLGIAHESLTHPDADSDRDDLTREELLDALLKDAERAYATREAELEEIAGEGAMRQLERNVLLNVIDRKWREHLYEMDYLKEGIGLRAMAQRDPLVEYQREGYDMFMAMLDGMKEESVGFLFNVTVEAAPAPQVAPVQMPEGLAELGTTAAGQPDGEGEAPAVAREEAPSTLRAKGIDDEVPALTYSGPSEDGSAQVQRNGGGAQKTPAGVPGGASRRERREAARRQGRGAKPPKSVKRR
jgi:preprotein translocase subunit SecA